MAVEFSAELRRRAAVHAALADPARLAIVDTLLLGELAATPPRLHWSVADLCTHNAGRSQVAMAELGIDISGEYPKPRTDEIERRVRLLLTELGVPARANQPRRW